MTARSLHDKDATAGNRTRVETLGGFHHATRPRLPGAAGMRSAGAGCRLQTCRRGDPQRFDSAFPASALRRVSTHGLVGYDVASTRRRSSVRIRVAVLFRDWVWTAGPRLLSPRGAMEARRFPEPEVVGSIPTAGVAFAVTGSGLG